MAKTHSSTYRVHPPAATPAAAFPRPLRPLQAAAAICSQRDWRINNFQLQNILYAAHAEHLHKHGVDHPLTTGEFYAWDCGPVLPAVFEAALLWDAHPIAENGALNTDMLPEDWREQDRYATLRESGQTLQRMSHDQLKNYATQKGGAWHAVFNARGWPRHTSVISDDAILAQYKQHLRRPPPHPAPESTR